MDAGARPDLLGPRSPPEALRSYSLLATASEAPSRFTCAPPGALRRWLASARAARQRSTSSERRGGLRAVAPPQQQGPSCRACASPGETKRLSSWAIVS